MKNLEYQVYFRFAQEVILKEKKTLFDDFYANCNNKAFNRDEYFERAKTLKAGEDISKQILEKIRRQDNG